MENEMLKNALRATGIPMGKIAEMLGMTRQNVNYHLRKENIDPEFLALVKSKLKLDFPNVKHQEVRHVDLGDRILIDVPLVNQYAYAGYLAGYGDPEFVENLPTTPFIVEKEPKGKYMAFELRGDSMDDGTSDSYLSGDILLCREIKRELWQSKLHIKKWDFVIVHRTRGVVIKKITSHNTGTGQLTLHSINTEYEDYTVKIDDVLQIFNVVQVMRKK